MLLSFFYSYYFSFRCLASTFLLPIIWAAAFLFSVLKKRKRELRPEILVPIESRNDFIPVPINNHSCKILHIVWSEFCGVFKRAARLLRNIVHRLQELYELRNLFRLIIIQLYLYLRNKKEPLSRLSERITVLLFLCNYSIKLLI